MLAVAKPQLKAMILLGAYGGLGNNDCSSLPLTALDFDARWLDYPRPKTGIHRRIPLWHETVLAVEKAISCRPEPKDPGDAGHVFLTRYGRPCDNPPAFVPV